MARKRTRSQAVPRLVVRALSARSAQGVVEIGALRFPCALGRRGVVAMKREGDGATPRGVWAMCQVFYHPRRVRRPLTALRVRTLRSDDGWCDAVLDRNYNRFVRHPYTATAERLWRNDEIYDLIVVLEYNVTPRVQGRGSAIFLHVARTGRPPTEGCIAVRRDGLLRILSVVRRGDKICVEI